MLRQWFSNFSVYNPNLEGLVKHTLLGSTPIVSESVGLG